MDKETWKRKTKAACKKAGTYRPYFDAAIDTLSEILAKRDKAQKLYEESGEPLIVAHTNKSGATNLTQSPIVRLINDLNRDALTFWRDLGLTPAGLKKLNEEALKAEKAGSALEEALKGLGGA